MWYALGAAGVVLIIVLLLVGMYNSLVKLRNMVDNAWSQIDVQLKRRHDLIPNLIETVKGYMKHERETLETVTKYRNQAMQAGSVKESSAAESLLGGALGRLLVTVEQYPDLKANQNFLSLQEELTTTENRISFARQAYNDGVLGYNNKVQMFPSNIIAGMFGFAIRDYFELEDKAEKEVPTVSF